MTERKPSLKTQYFTGHDNFHIYQETDEEEEYKTTDHNHVTFINKPLIKPQSLYTQDKIEIPFG